MSRMSHHCSQMVPVGRAEAVHSGAHSSSGGHMGKRQFGHLASMRSSRWQSSCTQRLGVGVQAAAAQPRGLWMSPGAPRVPCRVVRTWAVNTAGGGHVSIFLSTSPPTPNSALSSPDNISRLGDTCSWLPGSSICFLRSGGDEFSHACIHSPLPQPPKVPGHGRRDSVTAPTPAAGSLPWVEQSYKWSQGLGVWQQ